jgi:HAD superfamily hydrolase (TIGR01509 family)
MTPYAGIIFDFNGVLWWDHALVEIGWQRTAMELRGREFSPEEFARVVHGCNGRDTLEYLAGCKLEETEVRRLIDDQEVGYRERCLQAGKNFRLSPGAEELLDFLRARNIPRTIATASEKMNVDFFVERLGLAKWFDPSLIVCDNGILRSKPAPDFYLQAAANLKLEPARCVVVEDAFSGMRAARAAGIGFVVALGYSSLEEAGLKEIPIDAVVSNLGQLDRRRLFGGTGPAQLGTQQTTLKDEIPH